MLMTIIHPKEKEIPDGFPVANSVNVDINRKGFRFHGNAYDITRVANACQNALREIEHKHLDPFAIHSVLVIPPAEDEL